VWLVDEGNTGKKTDNALKAKAKSNTETYAEKVLLPQLGFDYILPLSRTSKQFPFDFYCEKDEEKWFIDVTAYVKKHLRATPLWAKLGVKIGVLFIRRDLQEYCFKEATDKSFVSLNLQDVGLKPILSPSEVLRKVWETRRAKGIKKNPLTEDHKRHISESLSGRPAPNKGKPAWNKGLTKETDERVAKYSGRCWNKGLTKETDPRVAKAAEHRWREYIAQAT